MLSSLYAKWMWRWETALTFKDSNRIVRPLEWGFDWLSEFVPGLEGVGEDALAGSDQAANLARMIAVNEEIVARADEFFSYATPSDFRLEERHPLLFPTNVRPETLSEEAEVRRRAAAGEIGKVQFLRFTSPVRTKYPENDVVKIGRAHV